MGPTTTYQYLQIHALYINNDTWILLKINTLFWISIMRCATTLGHH